MLAVIRGVLSTCGKPHRQDPRLVQRQQEVSLRVRLGRPAEVCRFDGRSPSSFAWDPSKRPPGRHTARYGTDPDSVDPVL